MQHVRRERVNRQSEPWSLFLCARSVSVGCYTLSLSVESEQFSKSEGVGLVILLTLTNGNRLGFGIISFKTCWNSCFDCICWFIVPVATDSSIFIRSNNVWNRCKRSLRVWLNQRRTNYVKTVYFVHQGKSGEILKSVVRSLFTLTMNEHAIANVCFYFSFLLKIIYIMIKYTFQINLNSKHYQLSRNI